jgi:alpha-1,3-rhamnosyltransferase
VKGVSAVAGDEPGEATLVTAVIPSYNHRDYIGAAIESVVSQTHPRMQLIVIDDGSTDGSVALLEQLAGRHGFELLTQENGGVCRALNRAIRERARGEYIALLGSDDLWAPDKIELQLQRLRADPGAELCFSQAISFERSPQQTRGKPFPARPREGRVVGRVVLRQHVPAGTMLFSRRLYDALGGFDERLREEDWDFVIRAAARTRFVAVQRPLLYYRTHARNTMRTRPRPEIFHQKMLILAKNFDVVPPARWLLSVGVHFLHDIVLTRVASGFRRNRGSDASG